MKNKRLLILGGSDLQVSCIKKAKEMGLYVITCDYLPNNPGHKLSHEYYNVSTTDLNGVLKLAKTLNLDGIIAYASDPGAITAAYVAEELGLPSNPLKSVEILSRKDLFRNFLADNGFLTPLSFTTNSYKEAIAFINKFDKTFIIKPIDSSGSKGVFKIHDLKDFRDKFENAISFSKAGLVIIEEFIEKIGYQIGGDGFLVNGKLVFRCFGDIHFSSTNPLLPCSVSVPSLHNEVDLIIVHKEVQRLLSLLGMEMGALNFDIIITPDNEVFIIEIGPRNGGNMIPELTKYCTGVDMIEYSIKSAIGEKFDFIQERNKGLFYSHYVIHSKENGVVESLEISEKLKKKILHYHFNFGEGDKVNEFKSSKDRLGIMILKYLNKEEMLDVIYNFDDYFKIKLK